MLMDWQQRGERHTTCTKLGSSSQSVVHLRSLKCMEEGGGLLQPIWTVCLDKIARYNVSAEIEKEANETVTTSWNIFSKHRVEILDELGKERLQDQGCALSFRSVHLSLSKNRFVADGYSLFLQD